MNFKAFLTTFGKKEVKEYPYSGPEDPMVSVCVQTYNQAGYIKKCLKSLLEQKTEFTYQILLGEDCSTDGTREICMDYADKHPEKIKLILHNRENNIQVGLNSTGLFNTFYNLLSARGKYIAYCDGDDFWSDPEKLQKQVDFLEKNKNYVITYHDAVLIDEKNKKITGETYTEMSKRDLSEQELKKALVQPIISTWCFRNCIKEIPSGIIGTMNADNFWISLLGFHGKGKYIKDIKPSYYRIHTGGIWSTIDKDRQFRSKMTTYFNMARYYKGRKEKELSLYFKKRSFGYLKMLCVYYMKNNNFKQVIASIIPFIFRLRLRLF